MYNSIEEFMAHIEAKNHGEKEFHQAVNEVVESLWDFLKDHPDYDDHSQAYFPHMDKENGIHVSLNLECVK